MEQTHLWEDYKNVHRFLFSQFRSFLLILFRFRNHFNSFRLLKGTEKKIAEEKNRQFILRNAGKERKVQRNKLNDATDSRFFFCYVLGCSTECSGMLVTVSKFRLLIFSIYLQGTKYDSRYPIYILLLLLLFGGVCSLFLPETLHQKLPDTLEEARNFGADQVISLVSWPIKVFVYIQWLWHFELSFFHFHSYRVFGVCQSHQKRMMKKNWKNWKQPKKQIELLIFISFLCPLN